MAERTPPRGIRIQGHALINRLGKTAELATCKCGITSAKPLHSWARRSWYQRHTQAIVFWEQNDGPMWKAIAASAGLTYRQIDHWTRRGYLELAHESRGSGVDRIWDEDAPFIAQTMARLVNAGLNVPEANTLARKHITEPNPQGRYRLDSGLFINIEEN